MLFLVVILVSLDLILSYLVMHHPLRVCFYPCYPRFHQVSSSSLILPVIPLLFYRHSPPSSPSPLTPSLSSFALASSLPCAFSCLSSFHVMSSATLISKTAWSAWFSRLIWTLSFCDSVLYRKLFNLGVKGFQI